MRLAYWIGILRMPSCTKTTATITRKTTTGSDSFSKVEPCHHAEIPAGADVRIDAKMRSDMPLPTPRWVISSPIHMRSVAPAVKVTTTRMTFPRLKLTRFPVELEPSALEWNAYV